MTPLDPMGSESGGTAECDPPAARVPCGWGCSRAAPAEGGCTLSAEQRGTMPGETGGWAPASWREASGPKPSTSAAAGAGWRGAGLRHTETRGYPTETGQL